MVSSDKELMDTTEDSREYKLAAHRHGGRLDCGVCPPNRGCNLKRRSRYGKQKARTPKYKNIDRTVMEW